MEATVPVVSPPGLVRLLPFFLSFYFSLPPYRKKQAVVSCDPRKKTEQRRCGAPRRSTRAAGAARGTVEWPCGGAFAAWISVSFFSLCSRVRVWSFCDLSIPIWIH